MIGVLQILSQVLGAFAFALLLPAAVGLVTGELANARTFLTFAGLVGFLAGAVFFALQGRGRRLDRVGGFVLVVAVWTIPPAIAAGALMRPMGVDYLSALFEAVSGYTTTGATMVGSVAGLGYSGIFFRAELQWLGGLMTLLTLVTVLAPSGLGGISDRNVALIASPDERVGRVLAAVRRISAVYSIATAACMLLLFMSGIRPFDAICLAFATVSTGGFMPIDGDLSGLANPAAEVVLALFMLVGATSVVWHQAILEGRWQIVRQHRESYFVIGIALVVGVGYAAALVGQLPAISPGSSLAALGDGLVSGISLVSTTGFEPRPSALSAMPMTIVLLIAIVGGGLLSTSGGVKWYRIGGMFAQSLRELRRLVYPHNVSGSRFGAVAYDSDLMKGILSNLTVVMLTVAASALLLGLTLPSYEAALTAAVSAFASVGPLYAAGWESSGWPPFSEFDDLGKVIMIATMVVGRFEVLALLGAVSLAYWRS